VPDAVLQCGKGAGGVDCPKTDERMAAFHQQSALTARRWQDMKAELFLDKAICVYLRSSAVALF
jgi:hypothetical protein